MEKTRRDALIFLDNDGWSELIDPRWTLEVYRRLEKAGFTDSVIRAALNIVCYPEPDYDPNNNDSLDDILTDSSI